MGSSRNSTFFSFFSFFVSLSTTLNLLPPTVSSTDRPSSKYWIPRISSMVPKSENTPSWLAEHIPNSRVPVSRTLLIMSLCLGSDTWRGQGILGKLVVQTKIGIFASLSCSSSNPVCLSSASMGKSLLILCSTNSFTPQVPAPSACRLALHIGHSCLWSKFLSMQFLQNVWPHEVVTGCHNKRRQRGQLKSPSCRIEQSISRSSCLCGFSVIWERSASILTRREQICLFSLGRRLQL